MYKRKKEIDARANCQPPNCQPPVSGEEAKELAAIEAELASFTPGPSRLDRDRTMFLAGRAAAESKTTTTVSTRVASTLAARRWSIGFATMTAAAGCLLVVLIVQQQTLIALRATAPTTTIESGTPQSPESPGHDPRESEELHDSPASQEPDEPPVRPALADDFKRRRFDFSDERLLALADSGTLTVRSLFMPDELRTVTVAKSAPTRDWPTQSFEPPSPPLPYYKLLRQLQQRENRYGDKHFSMPSNGV